MLVSQHQAGSLYCATPLAALASCGALKIDRLWHRWRKRERETLTPQASSQAPVCWVKWDHWPERWHRISTMPLPPVLSHQGVAPPHGPSLLTAWGYYDQSSEARRVHQGCLCPTAISLPCPINTVHHGKIFPGNTYSIAVCDNKAC